MWFSRRGKLPGLLFWSGALFSVSYNSILWRRKPLGYVSGAGMLFQGSMLFVGLIAIILLQPFLTGVPVTWMDVIVVTLMGSVCFVPFGLFVRGVGKTTA